MVRGARALEILAVTPGFWNGRRVLVTGHTGFKGAWLAWWLKSMGASVAGVSLDAPSTPSLFEASGLASAIASGHGDVREPGTLAGAFERHRPEVVFHLAAQSLVRESWREPVGTFATNVMGVVHCLEAARQAPGVRAVVVATSDKCYRNDGSGAAFRESDPLGGEDPYSASKAAAEIAAHAYRRSFFSSQSPLLATVRAGNVIGGGDWAAERVVPDAVRAFGANQRVGLRNPSATRPWQHVLDPLHGYLMLAERLHAGDETSAGAWNFGPDAGAARPVSWLVEQLAGRWPGAPGWERAGASAGAEATLLSVDSTQARTRLGWKPRLPIEAALDWVVEWYRGFAAGASARELTLAQLARYRSLAAA